MTDLAVSRIFRSVLPALFWLVAPLGIASCSPGYLFHLGMGQLRIGMGMEPVEKYLKTQEVPPDVEKKIRLVLEAKSFGEEHLGLAVSKNYTYFYEVKDPALGYNLIASPPLELEAHRWCFPVAGCVPYKGFFNKERAVRAGEKMKEKGLDIYIRPFFAYSTLGWFKDPIFSTWLAADETYLVETVLHEMTHATIYVKGQSSFNESLATFVGLQGAMAFFRERRNENDAFFDKWEEKRKALQVFCVVMNRLAGELRGLYASDVTAGEKRKRKDTLFQEAKQWLAEDLPAETKPRYEGVLRSEWNNAFLVAHLTYHEDVSVWEDVFKRFDGNLKAMVAWSKEAASEKDPTAFVRLWLESGSQGPNAD